MNAPLIKLRGELVELAEQHIERSAEHTQSPRPSASGAAKDYAQAALYCTQAICTIDRALAEQHKLRGRS